MSGPLFERLVERLPMLLLAGLCALALTGSGTLWRWDRAVYDALLPAVGDDSLPLEPVIVAIDERSLAELGRWPWPREMHARLVERLDALGVGAVALDLLFAEPSPDPADDRRLAEALARNGRVVLPLLAEPERLGAPLRETRPLPLLAEAAAGLGHVDMETDEDGIVRTTYLYAGLETAQWPNLALALARLATGAGAAERPPVAPVPLTWVREQPLLIPFAGPPGRFPRLSYADVLAGRSGDQHLRGRPVLVGVTAAGLGDALPTPLSGRSLPMAGVEVLANVYRALLAGPMLRPLVPLVPVVAAALAVLLAVAALALLPLASSVRGVVASVLALSLPLTVSAGLLIWGGLWWPPLGACAAIGVGVVLLAWRQVDAAGAALREDRRQAEATLRSIGEAVVTTDASGLVTYLNPAASRLLGHDPVAALGMPVRDLLPLRDADTGQPSSEFVGRALLTHQPFASNGRLELVLGDDEPCGVDVSVAPVRDDGNRSRGTVFAIRDVSEARRLEQRIAWHASHDVLTDLPNRALMRDRLASGIARARRGKHTIAVVFIDLDRFKAVIDSLGDDFGDRLLQAMATRLSEVARAEDTVARVGGDEFVVLLEQAHAATDIGLAVRRLRTALSRPYRIDEQDLFVTVSMGVSVFPRDSDAVETLLAQAEAAVQQAKQTGRNAVCFFSEDMNRMARRRHGMERALRRCLENGGGELRMAYQPIVALRDGHIIGVEALLRWSSDEYGNVGPEEFVSVAEECGLIIELGEWALNVACRQACDWQAAGVEPLRLAVNLSPRQFTHQDVPAMVQRALDASGLAAEHLELEITESVMMHDMDSITDALQTLKSLGVHVAVDDFGTGYSSLSFLKRFPVDRVKIDRSFVQDIGANRESTAIVKAVVAMARSLGLQVVAEGVETRSQVEFLRERECDEVQGFFLCRPVAAAELLAHLRGGRDLRAG